MRALGLTAAVLLFLGCGGSPEPRPTAPAELLDPPSEHPSGPDAQAAAEPDPPAAPPTFADALAYTDAQMGCPAGTKKNVIITTETPMIVRCEDDAGDPLGPVFYFYNSGVCQTAGVWGPGYEPAGRWTYYDETGAVTRTEDHP